jgi:hypothetical protein
MRYRHNPPTIVGEYSRYVVTTAADILESDRTAGRRGRAARAIIGSAGLWA